MFFDFYEFYRAIALLEKKLATFAIKEESLELLLFRSDSVRALGSATTKSNLSVSVKYLVLSECIRLLKDTEASKRKVQPVINQFQKNIDEYRVIVVSDMERELSKDAQIDASTLLNWYEKQFRSAA